VAGYALSERIEIFWVEDGDHDLKPRKGVTGVSAAEALAAVVARVRTWADGLG
jgi:predicted alpha/beta-hydrolase family hydrolase